MKTHVSRLVLFALILVGFGIPSATWAQTARENGPRAIEAVQGLLDRLFPQSPQKEAFVFVQILNEGSQDCFEIETRDGQVVIGGNNAISMAVGLNWYLKYHCHCHVSFRGRQLNLPNIFAVIGLTNQIFGQWGVGRPGWCHRADAVDLG